MLEPEEGAHHRRDDDANGKACANNGSGDYQKGLITKERWGSIALLLYITVRCRIRRCLKTQTGTETIAQVLIPQVRELVQVLPGQERGLPFSALPSSSSGPLSSALISSPLF